MKQYADILTTVHNLQRSRIHQEVMQDIQRLMDEKHYQFAKALKLVLQQNLSLFDEKHVKRGCPEMMNPL